MQAQGCGCSTQGKQGFAGETHLATMADGGTHPLDLALQHASALQAVSQCEQLHQGWVKDKHCEPCAGVHTGQASVCGCCTRCSQVPQESTRCRRRLQVSIHRAGRGCGYHTRGRRSVRVPMCGQMLHMLQAQPRVAHALQTWAAGGVPGCGQHTRGSRRLRVSCHALRAGLRVLHAMQTVACG